MARGVNQPFFKQLVLVLFLVFPLFEPVFSITADHPDFVLAEKYFQRENYEKASQYFKKVLVEEPDHIESHYAISRIHFLAGRWIDSFEAMREVLSIDKKYKDGPALFKQILRNVKEQTRPSKDDAASISAWVYLDFLEGRLGQAKIKIDMLTSSFPDYAFGWDHLANYYYRLKSLDQSMIHLKRAISLNPTSPTIFHHYESTYYLKNHKILPPRDRPKAFQRETEKVRDKVLDEWLAREILKQELPEDSEKEPQDTHLAKLPPRSVPNSSSLFKNLLRKEKENVPAIETKSKKKSVVKTPVKAYEPIPEVKTDVKSKETELIARAKEAFAQKNWPVAATSYAILAENLPHIEEYKNKFEKAKEFDQFEIKFKRALLYMARGARNKSNFKKAEEIFKELNPRTYYELYKKSSFDSFRGAIAFSRGNWPQAEKLYGQWLKQDPSDVKGHYYYLKTLEIQDKWDLAFEAYQNGIRANRKEFMSMPGMAKIRMKVYLMNYLPYILFFFFLWLGATGAYLYLKIRRSTKESMRKQRFQDVRDLFGEKRWNEMIQKIDDLLLTDISPAELYNLQYLKASGLYQLGRFDKAELQVRAILARHKNDQQASILLAKTFVKQAKLDEECLEHYRLLSIKEPSNIDALKIYLKSLQHLQVFTDETEKVALRILDMESYNNDILKSLVEIYTKRKSYNDRSADILKRYNELHPGQPLLLLHYLESLVATENFIEGIKTGKKIIDINPDLERAHQLLIQSFDQLNMQEEMKSYYHQLSLDFGGSEIVQKMYTLVENTYKVAGSLKDISGPSDAEITKIAFEEGFTLMEQKAYKQAILKLQTAANDQKVEFDAKVLITRCYMYMGDHDSAKFYFGQLDLRSRRLDENALDVIYEMAQFFEASQDKKRALQLYRIIARNDVTYKDTFQQIELLGMELEGKSS